MSNLTVRIISAAVILPPALALILFADPVTIAAATVVMAGIAGYEIGDIGLPKTYKKFRFISSSLAAITCGAVAMWSQYPIAPLFIIIGLAPLACGMVMFTAQNLRAALDAANITTTAGLYAGGLFGAMALIPDRTQTGRVWLILLLAAVILNDTLAYTAGRLFGKHKFHKVLSPNKTWEGSFGGILGSVAATTTMAVFFIPELKLLPALGLGIILGATAQIGDLMESFIKRSVGVKDAGQLIPGHGGILDRCDALMLGAPIVLAAKWLV